MKLFVFKLIVLLLVNGKNTESLNKPEKSNIKLIIDLLQQGEDNIKLEGHEEVVLVIGNTGAGKTTLTHFIARENNDLFSIEVNDGSGEYVIVDGSGKISSESTIISKTFFPELIFDSESMVAFFDCPGFSDTRSAAHDISASYFVKKVLDSSKRIKFVIVVNYSSVRKGVDRQDFKLLLKHVTEVIKNIKKYKNSISLVVTKVENTYVNRGRNLVPDEKVIETIAKFLNEVKNDIKSQSSLSDLQMDYNSTLSLLDIFLEYDGMDYKKIGLFRRPDTSGPISQIDLLQFGKKRLKNVIHKNTQFTTKDENDFRQSISDGSKIYVYDLSKEINLNIKSVVNSIGKQIEQHFHLEEGLSQNIHDLSEEFSFGVNLLSKLNMRTNISLTELAEEIKKYITLKIRDPEVSINKLINFNHQLKFFKSISNQTTEEPLYWLEGLDDIIKYMNNGHRWYNFLINLHDSLAKYAIQKDINNYNVTNIIESLNGDNKINDILIKIKVIISIIKKELPDDNIDILFNNLQKHILSENDIDGAKIRALERVLKMDLMHKVESFCESSDKLVIKGIYIMLSDIMSMNCGQQIKSIEIFAALKVFIDVDLNDFGQKLQVSIIAPLWDVLGRSKVIRLDGKPAGNGIKARSGVVAGENGVDGKPGLPGGTAGNFFGIAGFVTGGKLTISANGGRGGQGEDGGDGAKGITGETPPECVGPCDYIDVWEKMGFVIEKKDWDIYVAIGKMGTKPGNGGHGGVGGKGGLAGKIEVLDFSNSIYTSSINGVDGGPGHGGYGGPSVANGKNRRFRLQGSRPRRSKRAFPIFLFVGLAGLTAAAASQVQGDTVRRSGPSYVYTLLQLEDNGQLGPGYNGLDGYNAVGRMYPEEPCEFNNSQLTLNKFIDFAGQYYKHSLHEPYVVSFYVKLKSLFLQPSFTTEESTRWTSILMRGNTEGSVLAL